jgi:hypothetical protein
VLNGLRKVVKLIGPALQRRRPPTVTVSLNRLEGHDHAALSRKIFDIAGALAEPEEKLDGVNDDFGRESVALGAWRGPAHDANPAQSGST